MFFSNDHNFIKISIFRLIANNRDNYRGNKRTINSSNLIKIKIFQHEKTSLEVSGFGFEFIQFVKKAEGV